MEGQNGGREREAEGATERVTVKKKVTNEDVMTRKENVPPDSS